MNKRPAGAGSDPGPSGSPLKSQRVQKKSEGDADGYIRGPPLDFSPNPNGLGDELHNKMKEYSDSVAQIISETGNVYTYGEIHERCIRTARAITSTITSPKDLICICSSNHKDTPVPFIAAIFVGAITSAIDNTLTPRDTKHQLNIVKPKIIFASPEVVSKVETSCRELNLNAEIIVFGQMENFTSFDEFLKPDEEDSPESNFQPKVIEDLKDTVAVYFSSGSTGLPKGIKITHFGLLTQSYLMTQVGCVQGPSLYYSGFHWLPYPLFLIASILAGTPSIITAKFEASQFWSILPRFQVTTVLIMAFQCKEAYPLRPEDVSVFASLKQIISVGSTFSEQLLRQYRDYLPDVWVSVGYGSTEMCGGALYFVQGIPQHKEYAEKKLDSFGTVGRGVTCKLVNNRGTVMSHNNTPGELMLKSECMTTGYYNEESTDLFDEEGFVKSGDYVFSDDDHCFFFKSRCKEMLKYRGRKVAPESLENLLTSHPLIERAAVVSIWDLDQGDIPLAVIQLNQEAEADCQQIEEHFGEELSEMDLPRGYMLFVNSIPVGSNGKPQRWKVRNKYLSKIRRFERMHEDNAE